MEINFKQPFSLHMEVTDTDDHVPSMQVETKISVDQFQHRTIYEGAFWIECSAWSKFTKALNASIFSEAILEDISGYFSLKVSDVSGKKYLSWDFQKADAGGVREMKVSIMTEIDESDLGKIKREFCEFPEWW